MQQVLDGSFYPLISRTYPALRTIEALRHMSQGRHIGKLIIDMRNLPPEIRTTPPRVTFPSDSAFLVTGAFGGFGTAIVRWIVERGGRHFILLSRQGPQSEESLRLLEELRANNVSVCIVQCDVADSDRLAKELKAAAIAMPPIKGVFHAAMVIDDGLISQLNPSRFHAVMEPKVAGTWNLHALTLDQPLEYFVLFSSVAALVGNHAQANYAAANAFLDSFADYRRSRNLPATTVVWGILGEVGYVARHPELAEFGERRGFLTMTPRECLRALEMALGHGTPRMIAGRFDWGRVANNLVNQASGKCLLSSVTTDAGMGPGASDTGSQLAEAIRSSSPEKWQDLAQQYLREQIARVLCARADEIDVKTPLGELGLDSIMGIELVGNLEQDLRLSFSINQLSQTATIATLSAQLVRQIVGDPGSWATDAPMSSVTGEAKPADPYLVVMQEGRAGSPLFCIHPAGGDLNIYSHLVQALPADQSVYGIRSRSLSSACPEHESLEEMIGAYAQTILRASGGQSVCLIGFSLGGLLAVKTVGELERLGHSVRFVGLIESVPCLGQSRESKQANLANYIVASYEYVQRELGVVKEVPLAQLTRDAEDLAAQLAAIENSGSTQQILEWLQRSGRLMLQDVPGIVMDYLTLANRHIALVGADRDAVSIAAPIFIWQAGRSIFPSETNGNVTAFGPCEVRVVEGNHFSIMYPPRVRAIAGEIVRHQEKLCVPAGVK
jgi:thioesterase domain-containing protein/short-subunit dehydrogenase/acyl carrier protein